MPAFPFSPSKGSHQQQAQTHGCTEPFHPSCLESGVWNYLSKRCLSCICNCHLRKVQLHVLFPQSQAWSDSSAFTPFIQLMAHLLYTDMSPSSIFLSLFPLKTFVEKTDLFVIITCRALLFLRNEQPWVPPSFFFLDLINYNKMKCSCLWGMTFAFHFLCFFYYYYYLTGF